MKAEYNHELDDHIGILIFPTQGPNTLQLSNLIKIFKHISPNIYVITGNEGYELFKKDKEINIRGIIHKSRDNFLLRILSYLLTQIKLTYELTLMPKEVDRWVFMGGDTLIIPMLAGKLLNKKIIIMLMGNVRKETKLKNENKLFSYTFNLFYKINLNLCDKIDVYSENLVKEWNLADYNEKIVVAQHHSIDFNKFKIMRSVNYRDNKVAFVGRLSEEKGIMNFIKAIKILNKKDKSIKFFIVGNGQLKNKIESFLTDNDLNKFVSLTGWIEHDKLPNYLNKFKLLVLPSYTEGLPSIVLESMACGTPVLANPVGSIEDIIKDNKSGFIMENNSPECIAQNIKKVLNTPNLDEISIMASNMVKNEFNSESLVTKWKSILNF